MCSTEEGDALLHRSRGIEFVEIEVVESVVRGEENEIRGGDVDENAELDWQSRTCLALVRETKLTILLAKTSRVVLKRARIIPLLVTSVMISTIWQTRQVIFSRN